MNHPIEQLREMIQARFPEAELKVDAPDDSAGDWWLDVELDSREITIAWRPKVGFGICHLPDAVFGQGPDEVVDSLESAFRRVEELLAVAPAGATPNPDR
jgi:hypothetical protein